MRSRGRYYLPFATKRDLKARRESGDGKWYNGAKFLERS